MSIMTPMQNKQKSGHQVWSAARPCICGSKPFGYWVVGAPGAQMSFLTDRANVQTRLLSLSGGWSG